ncbi:retrovirus-related pol polyprotein from transposon TNT 1-94 [Tanacetum coccineum]
MTRSSTNKLFTPYKEPAREFRSSRRHFKTLSPDELRSPDFNLLSDQEYSEEEEAEAMAETMEQYMIKTRTDYGSGVARPKIDNKDIFEQKGQFLKELRKNTFSGSDNEDTNEHIEKVLKIVDLFHVPNITEDQLMLQVFPISLTRAEVILFYNGLDVPTRQILNSRGAVPTKIAKDAKKAIQEMVEYSQNGTMEHLKEENSTLLYKSRQTTVPFPIRLDNHYCEEEEGNYGPKFMEAYKVSHIRASVSVMPLLTYLNLGLGKLAHTRLTMELADRTVKYPKRIAENVLVGISKFTFPLDFIILDMPEDIKVPLILGRPFFLREIMELDLEARLMGETLVLNRSLDPFLEDYIELKDLNEPFELRRTQGDDLMPTIEEGKVIEKFRTRNEDLDTGIDDYPSYCDDDKKIHIDFLEDMDAYCDEGIGDITILKTNTPYPSRKIRRIRACTYQRTQRNKAQYAVSRETQYAVSKIWNEYNILEDIKRGPYSKKSPILPSKELVRNLPKLKFDQHFCDACKIGKQAHASHKAKNIVLTTRCLELLHMDLFGPFAVRSYRGNRYTLVIVDDYSSLRTPQSNGVVERKNRTLQEMSRTMLNEQSLPQKFWCNAVDTSTYILNRILIRAILGKTPYELLRGRKPTLDYFRVFGSKCFILNTKDYLTKFDLKSYEGVFLGYSQNSKAYIILNKHTRKVEESLNVTFDETPPPSKTSPLVDDDLDEEEAIKVTEKKNLENDIEDETLEIDEIVNIKESRNHPLENVIGNLNQRTLRSQAQNQSNFFCFISTIELRGVMKHYG